ncbi:hypothetical protein Tco_0015846 [Tanacetum coccineum]
MTQGVQQLQPYQRRFQYGNYSNAVFQYPTKQSASLSMIVLKVLVNVLAVPSRNKGSFLCGQETLLTLYVTSLLRHLTFLSFKRLIHQLEAASVNLFARDKLSDVYLEIAARIQTGETETGGGGDGRHNRQKTAAIIHWRYHIYSKSWQCWNTRLLKTLFSKEGVQIFM